MKERLDVLLVKRNLADSREKAKAIIMSGNVFVEGQREDKAGTTFPEEVNIEVRGHVLPYVSRGGLKLEKAMKEFHVTVDGKVTWKEYARHPHDQKYCKDSKSQYQKSCSGQSKSDSHSTGK